MCGPVDQIITSCSGCTTGSRRSINWSMSVKIAVLAPIPSASEATATRVKSGLRRKLRRANRRSNRNLALWLTREYDPRPKSLQNLEEIVNHPTHSRM